jgi:hypothetical protein
VTGEILHVGGRPEPQAVWIVMVGWSRRWLVELATVALISVDPVATSDSSFREDYGDVAPIPFWINLDSKAKIDELFVEWNAAQAKILVN